MDHISFAATLLTLLAYGIFILVGLWLDLTKDLRQPPRPQTGFLDSLTPEQ